jgi:hypothetical protein
LHRLPFLLFFFFCLFFFGAWIKPRASHMLGKRCTTELHPSPPFLLLNVSAGCHCWWTIDNCLLFL